MKKLFSIQGHLNLPRSRSIVRRNNKVGDQATEQKRAQDNNNDVQPQPSTSSTLLDHHRHPHEAITARVKGSLRSSPIYRFFHRPSVDSLASSSNLSISSSVQRERRFSAESAKSVEFEALIVDHPGRTLRVTLTPVCAA